jgi:glucose-1-phosphate thymidylyltransferase
MKGVILAGGLGTRMLPLTKITNKHLLPVYDRPMIYFPIQTLVDAGIDEIVVVTGGHYAGDFLNLLGNGKAFGLNFINYAYQEGEGGIADALRLAREFTGDDSICVILGDNILENTIKPHVDAFKAQKKGAKILLKRSSRPAPIRRSRSRRERQSPVHRRKTARAEIQPRGDRRLHVRRARLRNHPHPETLRPRRTRNHRRQQRLPREGSLTSSTIDGWWTDAGTFPSLYRASRLVAEQVKPELKENWF